MLIIQNINLSYMCTRMDYHKEDYFMVTTPNCDTYSESSTSVDFPPNTKPDLK